MLNSIFYDSSMFLLFCSKGCNSFIGPQATWGDGTCLHMTIDSMQLHTKVSVLSLVPAKAWITKDSLNMCVIASLEALSSCDSHMGLKDGRKEPRPVEFECIEIGIHLNQLISKPFVYVFIDAYPLHCLPFFCIIDKKRQAVEWSLTAQSSGTLDAVTMKMHYYSTTAVFM